MAIMTLQFNDGRTRIITHDSGKFPADIKRLIRSQEKFSKISTDIICPLYLIYHSSTYTFMYIWLEGDDMSEKCLNTESWKEGNIKIMVPLRFKDEGFY